MDIHKYALVRSLAEIIAAGLRIVDVGKPDGQRAQHQHILYCQSLIGLGFTLLHLPPDSRFPDSVFVEDPAVILEDVLVTARLKHPKRHSEEARITEALRPYFSSDNISYIQPPGFLEGGDVLIAGKQLYIGLTERTNREGAEQLAAIANEQCGMETTLIPLPNDTLHLKGVASFHEESPTTPSVITVDERFASSLANTSHVVVRTLTTERFGANCLADGDRILVHEWATDAGRQLAELGFSVQFIDTSEFAKIDGAMTCLSKVFSSP